MKTIQGLGHEVVTVNFINAAHVCANYRPFFIKKPNVAKPLKENINDYLSGWGQFMKFQMALSYLNLTHPVFNATQINALGLDALVVGSDEVWNFRAIGYHPVKFGVGLDVPILVSYAAGTGSVMPGDESPAGIVEGLRRFDRLSVRERNGARFIEHVLGMTPRIVLDPTLLYSFQSETARYPTPDEDYILVYQCTLDQERQEITRKYAEDNGLMIVGAGCNDSWFDKGLINIEPFKWVSLFKNARIVVTGTFHGTLFALKYRRPFLACSTMPNRTAKIESYLSEVGLEHRMNCRTAVGFATLLDTAVDYAAFDHTLQSQHHDSIGYLHECLMGCQR